MKDEGSTPSTSTVSVLRKVRGRSAKPSMWVRIPSETPINYSYKTQLQMLVDKAHKRPLIAKTNIDIYVPALEYNNDAVRLSSSSNVRRITIPRRSPIYLREPIKVVKFSIDTEPQTYEISNGICLNLWPQNLSSDLWFRGYIPAGTKYWLDLTRSKVMAESVVVTDPIIGNHAGLDINLSAKLYKNAEKIDPYSQNSYIRIGDFMMETLGGRNLYVSPYAFSEISEYKVKGIVVGFSDSIPLVADIFNIGNDMELDTDYYSNLCPMQTSVSKQAEADFGGWTNKFYGVNVYQRDPEGQRFKVARFIQNLGPTHYLPAFGELLTLFRNIPFIAAACSIAGIQMPTFTNYWFWSSTEQTARRSWTGCLGARGISEDTFYKDASLRVIPFIASSTLLDICS